MDNVHTRWFAAPLEQLRPWIEACWSGGDRDCFPRDVIPSWRRNPAGVDPQALIPGTTLLGHGPFRFRLRAWDGWSWKVDVEGKLVGWHGFELVPEGDGCRVTHTLQVEPSLSSRLTWVAILAVHNWAVEAIFDRLADALATGRVPAATARRRSPAAALGLWLARRLHRRRRAQHRERAHAA